MNDAWTPEPHTAAGRAGLAALIATPASSMIALDFDGTLAAIVPDPTAVRPYPGALDALKRLAPLVGTLAVISGRPALSIVEYGHFDQVPGLLVLGHYGRERWEDGHLAVPPSHPGVAVATREIPEVLAEAGEPPGVWIEEKGEAVAIHMRRAHRPAAVFRQLRGPLAELAARTGLVMEPGRLVIELRPPGADKGSTMHEIVSEGKPSAVLFCGDDLGDGPAFSAVAELRDAGTPGLTVWSRSAEVTEMAEHADLIVDGPGGVIGLLDYLAKAFRGASG
jgi:trehalose 6-phosphate phosphatase